jgi:3-hydroxypropanoate dehydrogenase
MSQHMNTDEQRERAVSEALAVRARFADLSPEALQAALAGLLTGARSHKMWLSREVDDSVLRQLHELMKWGPTSANCSPARILFVRSREGKARLIPTLDAGNVAKAREAPVTAVIAYDTLFYEHLSRLFPAGDHATHFRTHPDAAEPYALRNSTLQGAWLIIAARALGLDVGPMSGFDNAKVDEAFFHGTSFRSNFMVNLGYGDVAALPPRLPRLSFEEMCTLL